MEILLAKSAGFCFGVNNAVKMVYNLMNKKEGRIYTLGPIIHNEQVVSELKEKGIGIISDVKEAAGPAEAGEKAVVVIRAHGVPPGIYEEAGKCNLGLVDATCPYVMKIHKLVREKYREGYKIVIAGDKQHPEVTGINGWCDNTAFVANNPEDMEAFDECAEKCCLVAQTTITEEKFESIYNKLKEKCKNVIKFDTICSATSSRQKEAGEIARKSDMMLVIGSKKSSNTQKLYEIGKLYCPKTYFIETSGDLPPININEIKTLGITAGASTPERIIKEVTDKMEELNKQEKDVSIQEENKQEKDLNFQDAFEGSIVTLNSGEIVKGKIIGFNNAEIYVDLGYKSDGIIPTGEYSDDPDFKPETDIKIGEEIEVYIVRVNDGEGNVMLSKKKVDSMRSIDSLEEAYTNKTPVTGKVVEVTNGGIIASIKGVRVFIPASQIAERYVKDLNEYLRQTVTVRIIEFNRQKRKMVGSRKVILTEERERAEEEFWSNIEVGKKYDGTVKSLTDFGAFVDIGGVDGLVHVSEISWSKIKHPSDVLKTGDKVQVTVLSFDRERKRISLGMRREEDNPWYKAEEKYKVGDVVKGTVVRLVPFGAFVELEKGLDGLVHISQISSVRIAKPGDVLKTGQEVEAKIVEFNKEAKKISLSIKEVNPIDPEPAAVPETEAEKVGEQVPEKTGGKAEEKAGKKADSEAAVEANIPREHTETLVNTIADAIKEAEKVDAAKEVGKADVTEETEKTEVAEEVEKADATKEAERADTAKEVEEVDVAKEDEKTE